MKWKVFETVTEKDTPDGPEKKKTGPVIRSGKPAECVLNFQQCLQGGHKNTNKDNCTCVVNFEIDGGKLKINKPPSRDDEACRNDADLHVRLLHTALTPNTLLRCSKTARNTYPRGRQLWSWTSP